VAFDGAARQQRVATTPAGDRDDVERVPPPSLDDVLRAAQPREYQGAREGRPSGS
jgi:hypothetical protein